MKTTPKNQKRYNLHSKIRNEGYKLVTRKRTIYVSYQTLEFSENVLELRDVFGYAIQTEII